MHGGLATLAWMRCSRLVHSWRCPQPAQTKFCPLQRPALHVPLSAALLPRTPHPPHLLSPPPPPPRGSYVMRTAAPSSVHEQLPGEQALGVEAEAFWCFERLMRRMEGNFSSDSRCGAHAGAGVVQPAAGVPQRCFAYPMLAGCAAAAHRRHVEHALRLASRRPPPMALLVHQGVWPCGRGCCLAFPGLRRPAH